MSNARQPSDVRIYRYLWFTALSPFLIFCFSILIYSSPALAQEPAVPRPPEVSSPEQVLLEPQDWYKVNSLSESVLATTLAREKWGGDYDRFLLSMYLDQYQAKWFDFDARLKIMTDNLTRRYALREDQLPQVRQLLVKEAGTFLFQNGRDVMNFAHSLQAERIWDQPFTAATAARWAELHAPLLQTFTQTVERFATDFTPLLDDQQRALLESDQVLWKERSQRFQILLAKWQSGEWTTAEWGLNPDGSIPLHGEALHRLRDQVAKAKPLSAPQGLAALIASQPADPLDADLWTQLVERYITYYELDPAVAGSARAILRDVIQRYTPRQKQYRHESTTLATQMQAENLSPERSKTLQTELARRTAQVQLVHDRLLLELFDRLDRLLSTRQAALPPMPGRPLPAASQPGR
jgi:hypothetical protein